MKLSELRRAFTEHEDYWREFAVFLVDVDQAPDDDVDVIISPLREIEIDTETQQVRLYSAAARPDSQAEPLGLLEMFLSALPLPGVLPADFDVVVEVPVSPADAPTDVPELTPLRAVIIGRESEEIWLLVSDPSEYPSDVLPT